MRRIFLAAGIFASSAIVAWVATAAVRLAAYGFSNNRLLESALTAGFGFGIAILFIALITKAIRP